jgi:hypothetical protein
VSIVAADLVLFASANMPDDDASTAGGAIDLLRRLDFTQLAADDDVEAISSNAGDTMNLTITARKPDGTVVAETKALTGTTAAIFATIGTVERILKAELASAPAGNVTVRRSVAGATVRVIPAGERGFVAMFRKLAADVASGSTRNFYAKGFWKNTHATLALLTAMVKQNADADARITHLLASAVDDTNTVANRVTAPGAAITQDPDTFDDNDKTVPGTDLAPDTAIGVWFRMQLPAGDTPHRYSYVTELTGQSV